MYFFRQIRKRKGTHSFSIEISINDSSSYVSAFFSTGRYIIEQFHIFIASENPSVRCNIFLSFQDLYQTTRMPRIRNAFYESNRFSEDALFSLFSFLVSKPKIDFSYSALTKDTRPKLTRKIGTFNASLSSFPDCVLRCERFVS